MKKVRKIKNQLLLAMGAIVMLNAFIAYLMCHNNRMKSNPQDKEKNTFNAFQETPAEAKEMYEALS